MLNSKTTSKDNLIITDLSFKLDSVLKKEWLDTNGLGGYSSSTIINCHTRKYHGMLVASLENPRGRFVLLSKLELSLLIEGKEFLLSTNQYPGVFHPTGYQNIEKVSYEFYPTITYKMEDTILECSTLMIEGENTVLLRCKLIKSNKPVLLRIKPLLNYREMHETNRENMSLQVKTHTQSNGFKIEPYSGMPPLYFQTNVESKFYPGPKWYYNFEFHRELERGYPYKEDLFCPGIVETDLDNSRPFILAASAEDIYNNSTNNYLDELLNKETQRRADNYQLYKSGNRRLQDLKYFAGQFLVRNRSQELTIIAGYHWFLSWGRDTMIALPGITFCCGRVEEGLEVLRTYARREKDGLIPNFICEDENQNAYNSIDAALWYFWAIQQYLQTGGDFQTVREFFASSMRSIIESQIKGKVPHCHLTEDGLLYAGSQETQLTWMDANSYGKPVTPRYGCAVEINALWYNALKFWQQLCQEWQLQDDLVDQTFEVTRKIEQCFVSRFWVKENECLADVVREDFIDNSIRPNQVFVVSLPFSPIESEYQQLVVEKIVEHLLTPYGLRTLSPQHPDYKPRYEGDQDVRDAAYHQGTVWPWLLGHFVEAYLKVNKVDNEKRVKSGQKVKEASNQKENAISYLRSNLKPILVDFVNDYGIASIAEIFDGDPPHRPNGCVAQAWSVAEIIRVLLMLGDK